MTKQLLYGSYNPMTITEQQKDFAIDKVEQALVAMMEQDGFILDNKWTRPVLKERIFDIIDKDADLKLSNTKIWINEKLDKILDYIMYDKDGDSHSLDGDGGFGFKQQVRHNYKHKDLGTAFVFYSYEFITQVIIPAAQGDFKKLADLLEPLTNLKDCISYYVRNVVLNKDFRKETRIMWAGTQYCYDIEIVYNIFGKELVCFKELKDDDGFTSIEDIRKAIYSYHCDQIKWNGQTFDNNSEFDNNLADLQKYIYESLL